MNLFRSLTFKLAQLSWSRNLTRTKQILASDRCWEFLDKLEVPGLGTELLRVDFLTRQTKSTCWTESSPTFGSICAVIDVNRAEQLELLNRIADFSKVIEELPNGEQAETTRPWKKNEFLSLMDMVGLYGMLSLYNPGHYLEIGCGMSTRVAMAAIQDNQLKTHITCVDPNPRIPIPASAATHIPQTLESSIPKIIELATPGTFLFFDGSHRCFPGSDVTMFFLSLLPQLPPGVIVHIHDIYLPFDYPESRLERYWSEQYMLASWLLGGSKNVKVVLPGRRLESDAMKHPKLGNLSGKELPVKNWTSFWLETI